MKCQWRKKGFCTCYSAIRFLNPEISNKQLVDAARKGNIVVCREKCQYVK